MRVALCSKAFLPNVGGIETSSAMMATIWNSAGHEVEVLTAVPDTRPASEPYTVTRSWRARPLMGAIRKADVVVVNGYSRIAVTAALLGGRRVIVFHQGYQLICSDGLGFRGRRFHDFETLQDLRLAFGAGPRVGLKAVARMPYDAVMKHLPGGIDHVVPSHHVGRRLGLRRYRVIYQPPNPAVIAGIRELGEPSTESRSKAYQTGDVVFLGRLVFEKGCDDLLKAYDLWRRRNHDHPRRESMPRLVVYGRGPELEALQGLASSLGIADHVQFNPFVGGRELARIAREASVVVVPSRWEEPGGTIGVELYACGAAVITTERGALGEIFSGQGRVYPNGDVEALADALAGHFSSGPIYPQPTGREPWLVPAIELDVLDVLR